MSDQALHAQEARNWLERAANQNNSEAQIELAIAYATGEGGQADPEKALTWLKKARSQSDAGRVLAQVFEARQKARKSLSPSVMVEEWSQSNRPDDRFLLGMATRFGLGRPVDLKASRQLFQRLAEAGHAPSAYYLSDMLLEGVGGPPDQKASDHWCKRSADLGYAAAQVGMANRSGLDRSSRMRWLRKAAAQGFPLAEYLLGNALGMDASAQAERHAWLLKAARNGNVDAARELGLGADEEADQWLLFAAQHGHSDAQRMLGERLFYSDQPEQAIAWLRTAAEQGEPNASVKLGDAYWHGQGVTKDLGMAARWFLQAMRLAGGLGIEQLANLLREPEEYLLPYADIKPAMQRLADAGDPIGLFAMGCIALRGRTQPKDVILARHYFQQAAKRGHTGAMVELGKLHVEGQGGSQDEAAGRAWFQKAAERDDLDAMRLLADMLRDGRGGKKDPLQAIALLEEAAERGYPEEYVALGRMFRFGQGVPIDLPRSRRYFEMALADGISSAKPFLKDFVLKDGKLHVIEGMAHEARLRQEAAKGDAEAQLALGRWLMLATYDRQDIKEGLEWVQKVAEKGLAAAQLELAKAFERGLALQGGYPDQQAQALRWFRSAAAGGDRDAQYQLATHLRYGDANAQREAFAWALKAATAHHAEAEALMAEMYARGIGNRADETQAIEWANRALRGGVAQACFQIGVMFEQGIHVPKDLPRAFFWYLKGAEAGVPSCQQQVAEMYERGEGVAQSLRAAIHWYTQVAEPFHSEPAFAIARIYLEGPPEIRNEAEALRWYMTAIDYSLEGGDGTEFFGVGEFERFAKKYGNLARARYHLARNLELGDGLPRDLRQAAHWLARASDLERKYPDEAGMACFRLGVAFVEGWEGEAYPDKALSSFRRAMELVKDVGDNPFAFMASNSLDWEYFQAFPKVVQALNSAAKAGSVLAMAELAWLFQNGHGLPRHDEQAATFRLAATKAGYLPSAFDEARYCDRLQKQGDAVALGRYLQLAALLPRDGLLGDMLGEQRGQHLNAKAYRKVAAALAEAKKRGRVEARPKESPLGMTVTFYDPDLKPATRRAMEEWARSEGVSPGHAHVFWEAGQLLARARMEKQAQVRDELLEKAANLGSPEAMLHLSERFASPPHAEGSLMKAYQWMLLAQAFGAVGLSSEMIKLEAVLTPQQIAKAQDAAKAWWTRYHH
jgi:TPR repeat protein